jgi:hypothetical protein
LHLVFPEAQSFLSTTHSLIQSFAISWFDMNRVQAMLQPDTPRSLAELEFALQRQVQVQPT